MSAKKILGYIFIVLSAVMLIVIIEKYQAVDGAVKGIFRLTTNGMESHRAWRAIGRIAYWVAHFIATFMLWIYGERLVREN